jgi:hypothetical protein
MQSEAELNKLKVYTSLLFAWHLSSAPRQACHLVLQVSELQELLKAKGLDTKVVLPAVCNFLLSLHDVLHQGSKAVLVARFLAASAPATPAPAPAPAVPASVPAATSAAAAAPANQASASSTPTSSAAANDEAARLQRRLEKFGATASATVAAAPAAAVSDAQAEKIKKRGSLRHDESEYLHNLCLASSSFLKHPLSDPSVVSEERFGTGGGSSHAKGGVEDEARKKVLFAILLHVPHLLIVSTSAGARGEVQSGSCCQSCCRGSGPSIFPPLPSFPPLISA